MKWRAALTVAGLAVTATVAGLILSNQAASGPPPADLKAMSNPGVAASATERMRAVLERTATADGKLALLAERGDMRFYKIAGSEKRGTCFGMGQGSGKEAELNFLTCSESAPDDELPVLDASVIEQKPTGEIRFDQVAGWAADGIKAIKLLDSAGATVATAQVENNVYYLARVEMPAQAVKLAAVDKRGVTVWTANAG